MFSAIYMERVHHPLSHDSHATELLIPYKHKYFHLCNAVYAVFFAQLGNELSDTVGNNLRFQIFEVYLCGAERCPNRTLRNHCQVVKLAMSAISLN